MRYDTQYENACHCILGTFVVGGGLFFFWINSFSFMRKLLGPALESAWPTRRRFFWASGLILIGAAMFGTYCYAHIRQYDWNTYWREAAWYYESWQGASPMLLFLASLALAPFIGVTLLIKAYEKIANDRFSEDERKPGLPGLRAWCCRANVVLIISAAIIASSLTVYSFWGLLLVGIMLLVAYPTVLSLIGPQTVETNMSADISPERDRVMKLIEQGKISAEEGAELLSALAATLPPPIPVQPWTRSRKLMLAGAALVLVGFFMPWFSYNLGDEMRSAMQSVTQNMRNMPMPIPGMGPGSSFQFPGNEMQQMTNSMLPQSPSNVTVIGGDIAHGLGWIILLLSIGAAILPYVATGMQKHSQRLTMRLCVAGAGVIALYLLTTNFRLVSIGLPIVIGGIVLEALGLFQEIDRIPLAQPSPVGSVSSASNA